MTARRILLQTGRQDAQAPKRDGRAGARSRGSVGRAMLRGRGGGPAQGAAGHGEAGVLF